MSTHPMPAWTKKSTLLILTKKRANTSACLANIRGLFQPIITRHSGRHMTVLDNGSTGVNQKPSLGLNRVDLKPIITAGSIYSLPQNVTALQPSFSA